MSNVNPYQPPAPAFDDPRQPGRPAVGAPGDVSSDVVEALRQTKPWPTVLGIMGFITAGLLTILALAMLAMASGRAVPGLPPYLGLVYLPMAGLCIFPSLFMVRYGSAIGRFLAAPSSDTLAIALRHQKSYWRFVGILTVVLMVLYGLIIVGGVIAMASQFYPTPRR